MFQRAETLTVSKRAVVGITMFADPDDREDLIAFTYRKKDDAVTHYLPSFYDFNDGFPVLFLDNSGDVVIVTKEMTEVTKF